MKKGLLMVAIMTMATINMNAQNESKNEVGVFYGMLSISNVVSDII